MTTGSVPPSRPGRRSATGRLGIVVVLSFLFGALRLVVARRRDVPAATSAASVPRPSADPGKPVESVPDGAGPTEEVQPQEPSSEDSPAPDLRTAAVRGIRATVASRFVFEIGGFLSILVIARLITPADLGRASVALIIPLAATILTYEGFASALVQREHVTKDHWRTSMSLGVVVGTALLALTALFGLTLAQSIFDEETGWLLLIASPTFLLAGLSATSRARMQRNLMLTEMVGLETMNFVVATSLSVALAVAGFGAYGLLIGAVAGVVVETVGGWRFVPPVAPRYNAKCARDIGVFGLFASISGIAYVLRRSGPFAVLAAVTSPQLTGLYARAFQAAAENQSKLTGILLKVSFPVMARASSLEETQRVRRRIVSSNAIVVLPLLAILSYTAADVIPVLYGPQWVAASDAAQVLVLVGAAITLTSGSEAMAFALGRSKDVAVYNIVSLVALVAAVFIAAPHGIMAVAWASVAVYLCQLVFSQSYLIKRATGMPMRSLLVDAGPAAGCSLLVWAVGWFAYPPLASAVPAIPSIFIGVVLGLVLYTAALRFIWPQVFADTQRQSMEFLGRRG